MASDQARLTPFRTRLAVLAGARASLLAQVPREADRFTQILPLLIATAALSSVSMAFAVANGVLPGEPYAWYAAIPVALLWGALIFIVDRALTSSMKSTKSRIQLFMNFIPRFLLALLIGAVVSGPLVLQIFASDIRQEMMSINLAQGTAQGDQLEDGPEKARLDRAYAELEALRQQAQTGSIAGVETASQATLDARAQVATLQSQLNTQRSNLDRAKALYVCERNGAPLVEGCTGVAGSGPAFDAARAGMDREQASYDQLSQQLADAQDALAASEQTDAVATATTAELNRAEAEAALPAAQAEYDAALAAYRSISENISETNAGALGLLAQMRALEHLQAREPAVAVLHWAIFLLFLVIELMPVMVKMFRSYGDPNPYELVEQAATTSAAAQFDHEQRVQQSRLDHAHQVESEQLSHEYRLHSDRLEHERDDDRRTRIARANTVWTVEHDMLMREIDMGKQQNERVASQMEKVVGRALDDWEGEVDRLFTGGTSSPGAVGTVAPAQRPAPDADAARRSPLWTDVSYSRDESL